MPQRIPCNVLDVIPHGDRVYTVLLRPQSRIPRFSAGQFLHLALDAFQPGDFWPDSRVFSIASAPSEKDSLRITYAVKGAFTKRMERELEPGHEVWVKLPYGDFVVDDESEVCLLAGGTGITPFTAFLTGLRPQRGHLVWLFYGARRPELLIYRKQLVEAAKRVPQVLRPVFLTEQDAGSEEGLHEGRVDIEHVWPCLPEPLALRYYIAGPPAMISGLTHDLNARGVASDDIHVDAWD